MLARSGLVRKKTPSPIWGHFKPLFPWTGKVLNLDFCLPILLGGPTAALQPVWATGKTAACATFDVILATLQPWASGWNQRIVEASTDGQELKRWQMTRDG